MMFGVDKYVVRQGDTKWIFATFLLNFLDLFQKLRFLLFLRGREILNISI